MSYIISFILPLIYIVLFTYSITVIFKKLRFEFALPLTFIISSLILYISLFIFKTIYVGFIINILICLIFPIYLIKNKYTLKRIKEEYITNGFISFIFIYVLIYLYDLNRYYTRWDELSHWGKMVKEIIRLDNFYSIDTSHLLVHKDYPPMFSLMETVFTLISGGFKETYLIRCIHLFEGSIILSILNFDKKISVKKSIIKTFLCFIFFYILTFLFDSEVFINSIYIDYPLAYLTAFILFYIFRTDKYNNYTFIILTILLSFLILTKQIAISLYLVILLFLLLRLMVLKYKISIKRALLIALTIIIIPFMFYMLWSNYKHSLGLVGQFEFSDIHISEIQGIITNTQGEEWQKTASNNYIKALYSKNISSSYIPITYLSVLVIVLVISFIVYKQLKKKITKKEYITILITLLIGYVGFIVMMYLLYVFSFGPIEGPTIASFDRYMSTYTLVCLLFLFFILYNYKEIKFKYMIIMTVIMVCLIKPHQYLRLRPDLILLPNHHYDNSIKAATIIDSAINQDDKVFILDQQEQNGAVFYINYFSDKAIINKNNYELTNIIDYKDILKDYKYLYTYSLSTYELDLNKLYKIEINNDKVNLVEERST